MDNHSAAGVGTHSDVVEKDAHSMAEALSSLTEEQKRLEVEATATARMVVVDDDNAVVNDGGVEEADGGVEEAGGGTGAEAAAAEAAAAAATANKAPGSEHSAGDCMVALPRAKGASIPAAERTEQRSQAAVGVLVVAARG
jgi:hypothetical protein